MTFGFMTIVLNGGDYLWYSLENSYNLARLFPGSKIAIVEGADSFSDPEVSDENGHSIDGTIELIAEFPDPLDMVKFCPLGKVRDKRELRQKGLELLTDCDFIVIRDHDEFIKESDFLKAIEFLESYEVIELQHYLFQGCFGFRHTEEHGGFTLRIFKNFKGLNYSDWHIYPTLNGEEIKKLPTFKRIFLPFYHYGYVTTSWKVWKKRIFTVNQLNWFFPNKRPNIDYTSLKIPCHELYKEVPNYPFNRMVEVPLEEHPEEIKSHPWFGKKPEEIWNYPEQIPCFLPRTVEVVK